MQFNFIEDQGVKIENEKAEKEILIFIKKE